MYFLSQGRTPQYIIPGKTFDDYKSVWPADLFGNDWVKTIPSHDAKTIESMLGRVATDPIVLDLNGNGVKLTGVDDSNTYFDLHNSGFAVKTGWIESGDGFLVVDRNNNGQIDNITELFGNESVDGFTALQAMDSNGDGKIDAADSGFSSLKIWQDANGDGITDAGELTTLAERGITEIDLNTTPVDTLVNGNIIGDVATFKYTDGTTGQVAEAYFDNSQMDSTYQGDYTLNPEVLLLPNARGYGTVPDLFIAMSLDGTLLQMVKDLSESELTEATTFDSQIQAIIYRWAGIENVSSGSRGNLIDAQHLAALEKFMGQTFVSTWGGVTSSNPQNTHQSDVLEQAWATLFNAVKQRLLVQGPLADLFVTFGYNYTTDSLYGTADFSVVMTSVGASTPTNPAEATAYWSTLVPTLNSLAKELGVASSSYSAALQAAFAAAGLENSSAAIANNGVVIGDDEGDIIAAANSGSHYLISGTGNDTLTGSSSNDVLLSGAGNDTLHGGAGSNILNAGAGNDSIYIEGTADQINAGSGNDRIYFPNFDTAATVDGGEGTDTITLQGNIGSAQITNIETLEIASYAILNAASVQSLETIASLGVYGPYGIGTLYAANAGTYDLSQKTLLGQVNLVGSIGDDILIGGTGTTLIQADAGNDTLTAGSAGSELHSGTGTNILNGGIGNDVIYAEGLADQIYAGAGDDKIYAVEGAAIIDGGAGVDTLQAGGDISAASISGIESLDFFGGLTVSAAQLADMQTISARSLVYGPYYIGTLRASGAGTYDLSQKVLFGQVNLEGSSGDDVLVGGTGTALIQAGEGNDTLTAGSTGTELRAGAGTNTLYGGIGNDAVYSAGFNDVIYAGAGNDRVYAGSNAAIIDGGEGIDVIRLRGDNSTAQISGFETLEVDTTVTMTAEAVAGFESIVGAGIYSNGTIIAANAGTYDLRAKLLGGSLGIQGSSGDDVLLGGDAVVYYNGGAGNDVITAGSTGSEIHGGSGTNVITGGAGNDYIYVEGVADHVYAGAGDDTIAVSSSNMGAAVIDGGAGIDLIRSPGIDFGAVTVTNVETLSLESSAYINAAALSGFNKIIGNGIYSSGTIIATGAGTYDLSHKVLEGSLGLRGSSGDDVLIGGDAVVYYNGDSGNDTITSGSANSEIHGGSGTNVITGGAGNDYIYAEGVADQVYAGAGNDTIAVSAGSTPSVINGGDGVDTLRSAGINFGSTSITGVETLVLESTAYMDAAAFAGFQTIVGRGRYDSGDIFATSAGTYDFSNKSLDGSIGLHGSTGTIDGGAGDDTLKGGAGNDILIGGSGVDVADYSAGTAGILANLSSTSQTINGVTLAAGTVRDDLGGIDTLTGVEKIYSSVFADYLVGSNGADVLNGNAGNDTLTGGAGSDTLKGGEGSDRYLFGLGDGADTIMENDPTVGNTDVVNFGSGIGQQSLWFSQSGNNLIVNVMGTTDSITVSDWYSGTANQIEQFTTSDGMKLDSQLAQLVTAMASYAANNSGFNPTSATVMPTDTTLQTAIAAAWHA